MVIKANTLLENTDLVGAEAVVRDGLKIFLRDPELTELLGRIRERQAEEARIAEEARLAEERRVEEERRRVEAERIAAEKRAEEEARSARAAEEAAEATRRAKEAEEAAEAARRAKEAEEAAEAARRARGAELAAEEARKAKAAEEARTEQKRIDAENAAEEERKRRASSGIAVVDDFDDDEGETIGFVPDSEEITVDSSDPDAIHEPVTAATKAANTEKVAQDIQKLADEAGEQSTPAKRTNPAVWVALAAVLAGGAFVAYRAVNHRPAVVETGAAPNPKIPDDGFAATLTAARAALGAKDWNKAVSIADEALKIRPGDSSASQLKVDASNQRSLQTTYEASMKEARAAGEAKNWAQMTAKAEEAVQARPGDVAAEELKKQAGERMRSEEADRKRYDTALKGAQEAAEAKKWELVTTRCDEALAVRPGDATAGRLKTEAAAQRASLARYGAALGAAQEAMKAGQWELARAKAVEALSERAGDAAAGEIRNNATTRIEFAVRYENAMKAAQGALAGNNWDLAVKKADEALAVRAQDVAATELKSKATAQLGLIATFNSALQAGQAALGKKDWSVASKKAGEALGLRPQDGTAIELKRNADAQLEVEAKYTEALKAGRDALTAKNWEQATRKADEALQRRPGDAEATQIKRTSMDAQGKESERKNLLDQVYGLKVLFGVIPRNDRRITDSSGKVVEKAKAINQAAALQKLGLIRSKLEKAGAIDGDVKTQLEQIEQAIKDWNN